MTGISSSGAIKISSVSSNAVSSMNISEIQQLATACSVKSSGNVTGDPKGQEAKPVSYTHLRYVVMKEVEQEKRRKAELENGSEVTGALVQAILVVKKAPWHLSLIHISVMGIVEGARLSAGGDILLHKGMRGMRTGVLEAEGAITAKFPVSSTHLTERGDAHERKESDLQLVFQVPG